MKLKSNFKSNKPRNNKPFKSKPHKDKPPTNPDKKHFKKEKKEKQKRDLNDPTLTKDPNRLIVKNLPFVCDDVQSLKQTILDLIPSTVTPPHIGIPINKKKGSSKINGFALLTFATPTDANSSRDVLNGAEVWGRNISADNFFTKEAPKPKIFSNVVGFTSNKVQKRKSTNFEWEEGLRKFESGKESWEEVWKAEMQPNKRGKFDDNEAVSNNNNSDDNNSGDNNNNNNNSDNSNDEPTLLQKGEKSEGNEKMEKSARNGNSKKKEKGKATNIEESNLGKTVVKKDMIEEKKEKKPSKGKKSHEEKTPKNTNDFNNNNKILEKTNANSEKKEKEKGEEKESAKDKKETELKKEITQLAKKQQPKEKKKEEVVNQKKSEAKGKSSESDELNENPNLFAIEKNQNKLQKQIEVNKKLKKSESVDEENDNEEEEDNDLESLGDQSEEDENEEDNTESSKPQASKLKGSSPRKFLDSQQKRRILKNLNKKIAACAQRKDLPEALKIYKEILKKSLQPTVYTFTSLINTCVRCDEPERARQLFKDMEEELVKPNEVLLTVVIKGLCSEGKMDNVKDTLNRMDELKIIPNLRTYNTILRGCLRHGELSFASEILKTMQKKKVYPDAMSYEYLVKILCQGLRVEDAMELLPKMRKQDQAPSASMYSSIGLAYALRRGFEGAKKSVELAEELLEQDVSDKVFLNFQKSQKTESFQHTASLSMFDKLKKEEIERECDRVKSYFPTLQRILKEQGFKGRPSCMEDSQKVLVFNQRNPISDSNHSQLDFNKIFGNDSKIRVELCSGTGDWVVEKASKNKDSNWVSLEIRYDRVFQTWTKLVFAELDNLLAICGDGNQVLANKFPAVSVDEFYINFPEPPPSWKEPSKWLVNDQLLDSLKKILKVGASVIIVTDNLVYCKQMVKQFQKMADVFISQYDNGYINNLPEDYGSSYFDRLWEKGARTKRYFAKFNFKSTSSQPSSSTLSKPHKEEKEAKKGTKKETKKEPKVLIYDTEMTSEY